MSATLALLLLATGCKQCGGATGTDAGATLGTGAQATPSSVPKGGLVGIDLRSALILIFPEFRGAGVHGARAWVDRTLNVPGDAPVDTLLSASAKQKGYTDLAVTDGTLHAQHAPFELTATRPPGQILETLSVKLKPEDVQKLFTSPTTLGSEQLIYMLPKPEGAQVVRDTFSIELAYVAKPDRANFMVRQVIEGLTSVGWTPDRPLDWPGRKADGGVGDIPLQTTVTVRRADSGGAITVTRNGGEVYLKYVQPLATP